MSETLHTTDRYGQRGRLALVHLAILPLEPVWEAQLFLMGCQSRKRSKMDAITQDTAGLSNRWLS